MIQPLPLTAYTHISEIDAGGVSRLGRGRASGGRSRRLRETERPRFREMKRCTMSVSFVGGCDGGRHIREPFVVGRRHQELFVTILEQIAQKSVDK